MNLKRFCIILFLSVLGVNNVSAEIGKVLVAKGEVNAQRERMVPLKRGSLLFEKDIVTTGSDARANLLMIDGAKVTLKPLSELSLEEYKFNKNTVQNVVGSSDKSSMTMSLLKGGFRTISGAIGAGPDKSKYLVKTPIATIGIRGTDYSVLICTTTCVGLDGAGNMPAGVYFAVSSGSIVITNAVGILVLEKNQYAYVASANEAPIRIIMPPINLVSNSADPILFLLSDNKRTLGDPDVIEDDKLVDVDETDNESNASGETSNDLTSNEPKSVDPTSTEPKSADPTSTEPKSADPTSVEPTSVEPTLVEPTLVEPTSVEPTLVEPTLVEPTLVEPTLVDPTLVDPTLVEPTLVDPTLVDPTLVDPTLVDPTLVDPTLVDPTLVDPALAGPFSGINIEDIPIGILPFTGFPQTSNDFIISIVGADEAVVSTDGYDQNGNPIRIDNKVYDFTDINSIAFAGLFSNGEGLSTATVTPSDSLNTADYGLTQFYALSPETNNNMLFSLGEAQQISVGYDSHSGLSWGRWSNNFMLAEAIGGTVSKIDLNNSSFHWQFDNFQTDQALPISGSAVYSLAGNTDPTNNLGDVGILGTASFSVDFTNQTVANSLSIGINGSVWNASGSGTIADGSHLFSGTYDNVNIGSTLRGTGSFSGLFSSKVGSNNLPAGAGLVYVLQNDITTPSELVTGTLIFGNSTAENVP
ncbi:hypothetical protein CXF85_01785 [Colwellia sp. 75C3]|nr:FecR family protein [Colwellia sp. 75C3]PKG86459.1 hypothetical protein CXF85_01785 [Colwellia sp. 75C3]